jgi:predicted HicB family RNase H-like nuclease
MKQIKDGVTYNTETSHCIASRFEDSSAGWAMYQTLGGAFFMVITEYDGETQRIEPYEGAAALAFLAKHAEFPKSLSGPDSPFGDYPEDDEERRITIRFPASLARGMERAAKEKHLSLNSYVMRCVESCAANASGVDAMMLPAVPKKIMARSYQRSGKTADGTRLSSGAKQGTVAFPTDAFAKLKSAADKQGVSLSEMVRQCVDIVLGGPEGSALTKPAA